MNSEDKTSPILIAVTGGIGSGKSVVCRMLDAMGYQVYDCDSRAKSIMDCSDVIIGRIANEVCETAIISDNGQYRIDRRQLADVVFGDSARLQRLNSIVHEAVKSDITEWKIQLANQGNAPHLIFVETAILYESGLDRLADRIWVVAAPLETRIRRAMLRDSTDRQRVESRIRHQSPMFSDSESTSDSNQLAVSGITAEYIINDDATPLLPRVLQLLSR